MKFKSLNIIGGGPNAVYALEILLKKIFLKQKSQKKTIRIFEKSGLIGCGKTHSKKLNRNILLNRVAGQISLGSYPFNKFPNYLKKYDYNFMQWKIKQKNKEIRNLSSADWPPRYIFGLALEQKFSDLLKIYTKYTNVSIEIYFENVISIKKNKNDFEIKTATNKKFSGDKILVATGNYISSNKSSKLNKKIYNLTKNTNCNFEYNFLQNLDNQNYWKKFNNKNIIVYGTGVSSLDVISMLQNKNNRIYPVSRSYLFPFARPLNQKLSNPAKLEHKGIVFTENLINKLRQKLLKKQYEKKTNIENTLLPFLKAEFYLIYFEKYLKKKDFNTLSNLIKRELNYKKFDKKLNFKNEDACIDEKLRSFILKKSFKKNFYYKNWFSNKQILDFIKSKKFTFFEFFSNPLAGERNNFLKQYIKFLNWDINEANKGNLKSSFKKACDGLWRDLRPYLTQLFDDCQNQNIYKNFIIKILPIHNRVADGPSLEMIKKIKKMILNKTIDFSLKNNFKIIKKNKNIYISKNNTQKKIDFIFSAIANNYKENFTGDKLLINMSKNNLINLNKVSKKNKPFGLNLNKNQSPVNKKNKQIKNIIFIGPASEGPKFFHHTLSRPDKKQFIIIDLENWVNKL